MSGANPLARLRDQAGRAAAVGAGAGLVLVAWALLLPAGPPVAGWLVGLSFWLLVALGALELLAVNALTGGRWGGALWPALAPAAASLPAFLLLVVPLLLGLRAIYPWAADPGAAVHPDVARLYLNSGGFGVRSLLAVAGWSTTAVLLVTLRDGGFKTLVAALGLAFHFVATTIVALDWLLSLDPHFKSTAFGMAALVMQLLAALAWAAMLRPEMEGADGGEAGDLAALLLAATLGALYLGFSQYLVAWYGDLPPKAVWFLRREGLGWLLLQAASLLLAGLLPFAALLSAPVRRSPAALARLGPCVLAGILAHLIWIVAPAFGAVAVLTGLLGVLAVGGLWIGAAYGPLTSGLARRGEVVHGA